MRVWCDCCLVVGVEHGHAEGGLEFMESMYVFLFLSFCGWSVRARLIGSGFSVKMIDFGENRRFHRFGSADGHGIAIKMYVRM